MSARSSFIDTNVVVYSVSADTRKADLAETLLATGPTISVQVLNEFVNVLRSKNRKNWDDVESALEFALSLVRVVSVDLPTHRRGVFLARRYNFHIYDALIVASALEADCGTLYSEDMQHGLVVEDRLRIVNPFLR
jgi:predicted nucleic acid-binding protein